MIPKELAEKIEIAERVLRECRGIARTQDFLDAGLTFPDITHIQNAKAIEHLYRGYYKRRGDDSIPDTQYLSTFFPDAIICLDTALHYYGYSPSRFPIWTIARRRSKAGDKNRFYPFPYRVFLIRDDLHELGRTSAVFDGFELYIYDRERTMCDYFKLINQFDRDKFSGYAAAYMADDQKDLEKLFAYAEKLKLTPKQFRAMKAMTEGKPLFPSPNTEKTDEGV